MAVQTTRSVAALPGFRRRLLQGVSTVACATALGAGPASAQLMALRAAAHVSVNATGAPSIAVQAVPGLSTTDGPSASTAVARSLRNAASAQQAVNLAQQAQTAARQAAAAVSSGVPDGLVLGGLMPVANPVLAANDTAGLNTWQGANAPTQSAGANGAVNVDVQQTAQRAVLDWQTFNVGPKTTLTFDQSQGGVAQPGWVVLNRVVGQLDPSTGLRNPNLAPAPSQILGAIKAPGTVLVINQNGILFGAGAQINTNALIASSLEIGAQLFTGGATFNHVPLGNAAPAGVASTLAQRDNLFLMNGLLSGGQTLSGQAVTTIATVSNGVATGITTTADPTLEGPVTIAAGAQITSGQGGYILLAAPSVVNSGALTSSQGQVSLASGRAIQLIASSGAADGSNNPDVRGLIVIPVTPLGPVVPNYVENAASGLIQAPEGYVSLVTTTTGSAINAGVITATTSVARNGFIQIGAANIELAPSSVIAITAQDSGTIPQDPNSLANFKPSQISIGEVSSSNGGFAAGGNIDVGANSLIYAPNANIYIGASGGATPESSAPSRVFVDTGAVIDASGLKNVQVSGASHEVTISPVTANDTADTPSQRNVLDHATVTVDPRLSGVRSDGVAWVGSPLIPAQAYAEQVGVTASQLMTKGGNVVVGASGMVTSAPDGTVQAPDVIVKPGAVIDISGGWITYQAGRVQTTELVTPSGGLVNIGDADPNGVYLGIYNGYTVTQPRFGISRTYANPLLTGGYFEAAYSQGADAGSLAIISPQPTLEGTLYAGAFTGPQQALAPQLGTAAPTIAGDLRNLQAVGSQLPMAGLLSMQGAGGDVEIVDAPTGDTTADLSYGQSIAVDSNGNLSVSPAVRSASSVVPVDERATLVLSAPDLSAMGLGQLSIKAGGALTLDSGAAVTLAPGGVFSASTGRAITINGSIVAPSGTINLTTTSNAAGSIFHPGPAVAGDYDVMVNGLLSTAGLWTNDYGASGAIQGAAHISGGSIGITVASRQGPLGIANIVSVADTIAGTAPVATTDVSGSILIDGPNSLLDVSAGGYVAPKGTLNLTAKGGNVSLTDNTVYFPLTLGTLGNSVSRDLGDAPGFRVNGIGSNTIVAPAGQGVVAVNPDAIVAQVAISDGAIRGYGFAGGGTFSLVTPSIAFADGIASVGSNLPLDFFSKAGFGAYNITSYHTNLIPNAFTNGLGGFNAVLATQILTVQSGQTLNLTQTGYANHLTGGQVAALRALASGGQVSSIVTPGIQPDAYDQRPVSLNLGGLIEFEVASGGKVVGAPGAALSASNINNLGTIRLPGGALSQTESLLEGYAGVDQNTASVAYSGPSLSSIFSVNADGSISEAARSVVNPNLTNAQVAATDYIYLTGDLPVGVGINLAAGSVTDLSGAVQVNPYAAGVTQGRQIVTGRMVDGGALGAAVANLTPSIAGLFPGTTLTIQPGLSLTAAPGAQINLSGASGVFDQLTATGKYVQAPQWSNGGALTLGAGGTLTGAVIDAHGGAPAAAGGVLTVPNLVLTAVDPVAPAANTLSAQQIEASGFGTLVVQGDLTTKGDPVDLTLGQAFYLTGQPKSTASTLGAPFNASGTSVTDQRLYPVVSVAGSLQINAPYIALDGAFQALGSPVYTADTATTATGNVVFNAQALDVTGAVLFDQAVANVTLKSSGDLRLIGVEPYQLNNSRVAPSLAGQLAVNGNLNLTAAQVYAATGSSFDISSTAMAGVITIGASSTNTPAPPYSAGSNLVIQAANIVQDGVLRAPIGSLTLGGNTPLGLFAPATVSVELGAGSVTSVSANGLSVPYGSTTDQTEYFFSPTNANALTAPPSSVLTINGKTIATDPGATVNLSGGGDVFAYEFIPGIGGSRDVLNQFNADAFTSNGGYQYPDHRQVYAIVPGLSNAAVAAYDPIYSSNYGALYTAGSAGQRVYLNGGQGIAAGLYTLLPAQYAVLPGGMEVVEDTGAKAAPVGASARLPDGTVVVTGQYGGLGGTQQSTTRVFDIKSRSVIDTYSDIALTSGNTAFAALATSAGVTTPRLPIDSGRLVLNPIGALDLSGAFQTTPGQGGRGAEVDITGSSITIVAQAGPVTPGVIQLSADQLTKLNADSLLIGGVRTDNVDGTTSLAVTAHQITVSNDSANPLAAPDLLLAVDGSGSGITFNDGATLTASGTDTGGQTGAYVVTGAGTGQTAQGAFARVSSGAERLVTRKNQAAVVVPSLLTVGAVTLSGTSLLLDSSGGFTLSPSASLTANNIALDASSITFASNAQGLTGLVLTPALTTSLGKAASLTLRSPNVIGFASASYSFGALDLDTPGVAVTDGSGLVAIAAKAVQLQDNATDAGACAASGPLACGAGLLTLNAQSLTFGEGAFRIYGAGQGVGVAAPGGVFFQGQGAFDVGAAPLTIQTSFLGDSVRPPLVLGAPDTIPSLAITTTGPLVLTNPFGAAAPATAGAPGATLTLVGQSLSVTGVDVRATAGTLTLTSATGINLGAGATLETPGFSKSFGDAADPFTVSAPGGLLTLNALNGDITLAANSTLSVGGGGGNAGSLTLNAGQGSVSFNGTLNGSAPSGRASFALNEAGAFDLTAFEKATKGVFNGDLAIETGAGDLTLAGGLTLTAGSVSLAADGGAVDIAGTIDVSGVNGGNVGLFGAGGVTLESAAVIAARASGYAVTDTRQAMGGQVELGTTGTGAITVAAGAVIDVGAARTAPRVVEGQEQGTITYNYVAGDRGGTVTLRAPASGGANAETVNINFAGAIKGADSVVLEGFKAFDLGAIAAGGQFSGVTVTGGTAVLDTTASGRPNFLADNAPGTLVDFIQNFNVSAAYGNLGGLASQANFHARPGVELDYAGGVTLASNWNLGAGVVDVPRAVAAGLMVADPGIAGAFSVIPGDEGAVFSNFTKLTYRVGGNVLGEPGMLTIKAGGQLNINGSITDGFFTFGDQTDPSYLNDIVGSGNRVVSGVLSTACAGACATVGVFTPGNTSTNAVAVSFPAASGLGSVPAASIPYDAAANTPGALGSGVNGAGDPIGSAEIFPLAQTSTGPQAVNAWSYQLTGGAASGSADPLRVQAGAPGGVTVQGTHAYTYGGGRGNNSFSNTLLFGVGGKQVTADQWLSAELAANPSLSANSLTNFSFSAAPASTRAMLQALAVSFFNQFPGQFRFTGPVGAPTAVATSLGLAAQFLKQVSTNWSTLKTGFTPPGSGTPATATVSVATLIRSGTGSIGLAGAGDIDLRNGAAPTFLNPTTGAVTTASSGFQRGGVAIYTAGALVDPVAVMATDAATGLQVTLDPSTFMTVDGNVGVLNYGYGVATAGTKGLAGILVSNPVYAQGGGGVSLAAGGNVLGRRDAYNEDRLFQADNNISPSPVAGGVDQVNFIGRYDQPWRTGTIGAPNTSADTNILINPQLFTEGVGAIGGGNVTVKAGGKVSDLTVAADTTATTGKATGGVAAGQVDQGQLTYGGGNVTIAAAGNLLGGRVDVASGRADIVVGSGVLSAGPVKLGASSSGGQVVDNTLRLRLADATIDVAAHGDAAVQGIAALGVQNETVDNNAISMLSNSYAANFYSAAAGVSIVADGSVTLANTGRDILLTASGIASAVLPGSLTAVALTGNLNLNSNALVPAVLLDPSRTGTLTLAAGVDILPVNLAMLDSEPGPANAFPIVLPDTPFAQLLAQHDPSIPHQNDPVPNRIYAGLDIQNLLLSVPKQTRIGAGRDIVNMMFFGQNLNSGDISRIVAGRDITATTALENATVFTPLGSITTPTQEPTVQGNTFILGGPGSLMLEAGRNLGPFLNSATIATKNGQESFGGGVITVGNAWNPYLAPQGANIYAEFGVAEGQDFNALLNYYLNPANAAALPDYLFSETANANNILVADRSQFIYAPQLIAYMQANQTAALIAAYGTSTVTYDQAYTAFAALPPLQQRPFLLQIYFNELSLTAVPGPTFNQYQRGYRAVNLLFPSSLGYTANSLTGGTNGANATVPTGNLDLRLATIETQFGGNIDILGPGGRVLAGSTVATAQQAARRYSDAAYLFAGNAGGNTQVDGVLTADGIGPVNVINSIPAGYEGILTLRGGAISTFTDGDLVLNQSRLFTEEGGNITMWSSNGDLNAGQGPKTSSNFPPVVVKIDNDAFSQLDQASAVTGAGIAAFKPAPGLPAPDVFLIAPRGTVDAGAAGVRFSGNIFISALHVANADNFTNIGSGVAIGLPPTNTTVQIGSQTAAAGAAAIQAAQAAVAATSNVPERSIITVDVLGFGDAPLPDPGQ